MPDINLSFLAHGGTKFGDTDVFNAAHLSDSAIDKNVKLGNIKDGYLDKIGDENKDKLNGYRGMAVDKDGNIFGVKTTKQAWNDAEGVGGKAKALTYGLSSMGQAGLKAATAHPLITLGVLAPTAALAVAGAVDETQKHVPIHGQSAQYMAQQPQIY